MGTATATPAGNWQYSGTFTNTVFAALAYDASNNTSEFSKDSIVSQSAFAATASVLNNVSCFGLCNGSASVTTTGGTSPYKYTWSITPSQIGATANNLCAGNYTVTVTDDFNSTVTKTLNISTPVQLSITTNRQLPMGVRQVPQPPPKRRHPCIYL